MTVVRPPAPPLRARVAAVTGGGSGIGAATCRALAEAGAHVAVLDRDASAARAVAAGLPVAATVAVDVTDSAAVDRALEAVERQLGPVDIWVNNAGLSDPVLAERVAASGPVRGAGVAAIPTSCLELVDDDSWHRMIRVHLDGTFFGTRAAARSMVARGSGAIVNMASICGLAGCATAPHYSAAKAGIIGFTKAVAKELAPHGVRVNAVAPGQIETPLLTLPPAALDEVVRTTPAGRLGRADEVAATVTFLVSDGASYFVGATLSPNGGLVTT